MNIKSVLGVTAAVGFLAVAITMYQKVWPNSAKESLVPVEVAAGIQKAEATADENVISVDEPTPATSRPQAILLDEPTRALSQRPPDLPQVLEPVALGETAWTIAAKDWQNVGRATIGAAIQSQYWAISRGEVDYLASSIVLDGDARGALESLLKQVSSEVRAKYSTPETLASFFLATTPALTSIAIGAIATVMPETTAAGDVRVFIMTLEPGADRFGGRLEPYRQSSDEQWVRVIGTPEVGHWMRTVKLDQELSKSRVWDISK